ncbi:MAG: HNH endonuclease signature motif containing protein [Verrucomicrobiota bacterium]
MQLHHIRQKKNKGSNSLENCIPLCLECHAEVGTYNPDHPIGRRYTEQELREHRKLWLNFCRKNPLHKAAPRPDNRRSQDVTLHPLRLAARNAIINFIDLCRTYRTRYPKRDLNRTRELTTALDKLKRKVEAQGPLSIPELNQLYAEIITHAWNFQRLLDREGGPSARPASAECRTLLGNIYSVEDWFSQARAKIIATFEPFLTL